jgi:hypothetical protein
MFWNDIIYMYIVLFSGGTGLFLKLLIVISSLATLAHIIFHITLAAIATKDEPYGYDFANCEDEYIIIQ